MSDVTIYRTSTEVGKKLKQFAEHRANTINQQWVSQPKTRPQTSPPIFKTLCLLWRYFERTSSNSHFLTGAWRPVLNPNLPFFGKDARRLSPRVTKPLFTIPRLLLAGLHLISMVNSLLGVTKYCECTAMPLEAAVRDASLLAQSGDIRRRSSLQGRLHLRRDAQYLLRHLLG